jgi:hypothetical protein
MSWRDIAKMVGKSKSTVSDYLRKYGKFKEVVVVENSQKDVQLESLMFPTENKEFWVKNNEELSNEKVVMTNQNKEGNIHLYIPDNQVREGVSLEYLNWIGQYIVKKRPSVIISAGDFCDAEAASSYDVGKKSAEGKRIKTDIEVAKKAMTMLLKPLRQLQAEQIVKGEEVYRPRMVMTLGNHENRIDRFVNDNPSLHGFLSVDDLEYEKFGWEVVPFLTPIIIDGVAYCHYFVNVMTGKPLGGTSATMLKTIGASFTMGHRQTLDVATRFLSTDGSQQWGLIAGACYEHNEDYKGVQGNKHWRGIVVKHNVKNGSYDPLFISLDWLKAKYS